MSCHRSCFLKLSAMSEPLCNVEDFLADVDVGTSSSSNSDNDSDSDSDDDSISCDNSNDGDDDGCYGAGMIMLGKENASTTDVNVRSMPATSVDVPRRTMPVVSASQVTLGGGRVVTSDDISNHAQQHNLEVKENHNKAQQAQQQSVRRELLRGSNWTTQSQPTSRADYDRSSGNNTIRYDCDQMAMHRALAGRTVNQIKMKWKKADNTADDSRSGGNGNYQYSDACGHKDKDTLKGASASAPGGAPRRKSAQPQAQAEQAHEHEPASRNELNEEAEVVQAHPKKLAVAPKKRERGANWTREEEHTLLQLQKHNDNDWNNFAKHPTLIMGRRTAGQIETKWRGITRKGVNLHYLTKHTQYRNKGTCKGVLVAASKAKDGEQEEATATVKQKRHRSPARTEGEQQALSKAKDGEQEEATATVKQKRHRSPARTEGEQQAASKDKDGEHEEAEATATVKKKRYRSPARTEEEQQALSKDKDGEHEEAEATATVKKKRHRSPVWTEEEKQALLTLQRSLCRNEWEAIATHRDLASRTVCQIKAKWNNMRSHRQDQIMPNASSTIVTINRIDHAPKKQPWCRGRSLNWTKEEEQVLLDLDISEYNCTRTGGSDTGDHWEDISKFPALAGRRTALEVKQKYFKMKLLGPNMHGIRSKNWTPEEDTCILEVYERTTRSSSSSATFVREKLLLVAEALPGRTPAAVQIRFYTLRKQAKAQAAKRSGRTLAC
jgi:hypothetical protein